MTGALSHRKGSVAGSSLQYTHYTNEKEFLDKATSDSTTDHFVGVDYFNKMFVKHFTDAVVQRIDNLCIKNPDLYIFNCCSTIASSINFVTMNNETSVRFSYIEPILRMVCTAHGHDMNVERTMANGDWPVAVSDQSKADYVCWYNKCNNIKFHQTCMIVETKHQKKLNDNTISQTLGYYMRAKGILCKHMMDKKPGIAFLFNQYEGRIDVKIFLFPFGDSDKGFGVQALLLPTISVGYDQFLRSGIPELIFVLCMNTSPLLSLSPPFQLQTIDRERLSLVLTDVELDFKKQIEMLSQQIETLRKQKN